MNFPKHISFTYKSTYDFCPYKCYRQYHTGEFYWINSLGVAEQSYYLDYGSLVHDVIDICLKMGILDDEKVFRLAYPMGIIRLSKYAVEGASEKDFWAADLKKELSKVFKFLRSIDILNKEYGTEEYFETEFEVHYSDEAGNETVHLQKTIGIVDLWYRDGDDIVIVDWKTGKDKSQKQVDEMEQLTFYTWLIQDNSEKFGWAIEDVLPAIFYTRIGKLIKSRFRDDDEIDELIWDLEDILAKQNFEVNEQPPKFICQSCLGSYNCKYLNAFRSRRRIKKF